MALWSRSPGGGVFLSERPPGRRSWNGVGFAACVAGMAYALYLQHVRGLMPCHLCIFQRVVMIAIGLTFLAALIQDPRRGGSRVYGVILALLGAVGVALASRHVWLQLQPEGSVPACGASLEFMFQVLPPSDVLLKVFRGGAECQKIDWQLFGLSMPAWLIVAFATLGGAGLFVNWRPQRHAQRL